MRWLTEASQPILQNLVLAILSLIGTIVIAALLELRKKVLAWIFTRMSNENRTLLEKLAKEAYAYAERYYLDEGGNEKLNAAVNYVMKKINLQAIGLTREDIAGAVQRAWQDYNQKPFSSGLSKHVADLIYEQSIEPSTNPTNSITP